MNPLSKDIVSEWGLGDLPPQDQIDMVDRIGRLIYQAVLVRSLDILSEVEQEEFDLLLNEDTTTPEEVVLFLERKIPNIQAFTQRRGGKIEG